MDSFLVPLLIGVVALLLIASGIALWVGRRRAAQNARSLTRPPEDLRSLGISEIRAKPKAAPVPRAADEAPAAAEPADDAYVEETYAEDAYNEDAYAEAPLEGSDAVGSYESDIHDEDAYDEAEGEADEGAYADEPLEDDASEYVEAAEYEDVGYEDAEREDSDAAPVAEAPGYEGGDAEGEADYDDSWEEGDADEAPAPARTGTPEGVRRALLDTHGEADEAYGEADDFADFDAADLEDVRLPDPRDFEGELDLPMPLPDSGAPVARTPLSRAMAHLVEAAGAALRAQTVALLRHDAAALHFEVLALRSTHDAVVGADAFPSAGSALRTVHGDDLTLLKGADLDALGYYADASAVGRAYVQPLTREAAPSLLLVVDTAPEAASYTPAEKDLLRHFGSLIAHLAQQEAPDWLADVDATDDDDFDEDDALGDGAHGYAEAPHVEEGGDETYPEADASHEAAPPEAPPEAPPVSRRVIVAEEMARARTEACPLALALVHHADAEAVAQEGDAAIDAAEAALRYHLEDSLSLADGRVEPFGELMYGVFYYGRASDVEAWVDLVRTTPAPTGETLPIAIGVALLAERHDGPEAFRADAVQALADAYEAQVGCVIFE